VLTAVKKLDKRKAVTWYVIIKSSGVPLLWKNIKIKLLNVMKRNYLLTLHFPIPKTGFVLTLKGFCGYQNPFYV